MLGDALQWGALGLLGVVLVGLGLTGRLLLTKGLDAAGAAAATLQRVGEDNITTNRALVEATRSQGQRLVGVEAAVDELASRVETIGDMVQDVHGQVCGSKRTSQYERERSAQRSETDARKIRETAERKPTT